MTREVHLNELDATLEKLDYPVDRDRARAQLDDVVLEYADGSEPLSAVIDRIGTDSFAGRGELSTEIFNVLPVEAVGEPGQSEGEG